MFNYFDFTAHTKRLFCLCKTFIDGAVICKLCQNLFTLRYSGLLLYKQQQQQLFQNSSKTSYTHHSCQKDHPGSVKQCDSVCIGKNRTKERF